MWSTCWDDRNFARASEQKGGFLLVDNLLGGLYWEIRC